MGFNFFIFFSEYTNMNSCQRRIFYERSEIIPIPQMSPTLKKEKESEECSLNKMFFDPSKSSPPNEFMEKLKLRMKMHECRHYFFMNEDKRLIE